MADMNAEEVGVGSALATGAIYVAPKGTTLPNDATTTLSGSWSLLGFTSDAGVQISESSSNTAIRAWEGRSEVYNVRTEYTEQISFMPIQINEEVLNLCWNPDDVSSSTNALSAKHSGKTMEPVCIVIETVPRENIVRRYCGTFQLTERGTQTLDGTQVDGRTLTFNAIPDEDGYTMYEYTAFTTSGTTN